MKSEIGSLNNTLVRPLFPMNLSFRKIKSINYRFDPDTLKSWDSGVVEYTDVTRNLIVHGSTAPDETEITDKTEFRKLVLMEFQLMRDNHWNDERIDKFDKKPADIKLQRYALTLYLAKGWENWAFKMYEMFNGIDKKAADKQFEYIYLHYVIPFYREALVCLAIMGRSLPIDVSEDIRQPWSKLIIYARNKFTVTSLAYGGKDDYWPKYYKNGGKWLTNYNIGHLLPDYVSKPSEDNNSEADELFGKIKELVWSTWDGIYNSFFGEETPRYQQTQQRDNKTQEKNNQPRI